MAKIIDRIIVFFLYLILFTFVGCKEQKVEQENKQDSYTEMKKILDSAITKDVKNGIVTIEYCPDNTCESFSMPSKNPTEKLNDFVCLYLYFVSDYYYLADFRKYISQEQVTKIILRNKQSILKNEQLQDAKDIIESLAKEYSIKATFVRYDESIRNEVVIDIKSELGKIK
jgi:hypothetical protein